VPGQGARVYIGRALTFLSDVGYPDWNNRAPGRSPKTTACMGKSELPQDVAATATCARQWGERPD
jgi:hypothetical protein